jgi:tetratricopeptide (TPR) repeat protein
MGNPLSDALVGRVLDAVNAGYPALAIELCNRRLAQHPDNPRLLMAFAVALQEVARYPEARQALEKALRLMPETEYPLVWRQLGALAEATSDRDAAEQWYRRAIAAAPLDASGYIYLGAMLAKAGRLSEAEAVHRDATGCLEGCLDEAYFNLGLVLRAQERYLEALEAFREAARRDPLDTGTLAALEDMEQVLVRFPEA